MTKFNRNMFDIFARSWALDQQAKPEEPTFVCPLCMKKFRYDQANDLSKEHIPPVALGGKVQTLTCKECNNLHGRELDSKLVEFLKLKLFFEGKSPYPPKQNFIVSVEADVKVTVDIEQESNGERRFTLRSDRSDPKDVEDFVRYMSNDPKEFTLNFSDNLNAALVALLRIAYLKVFSLLGYSAISNKNYSLIREQISKPSLELLPRSWLLFTKFPDEWLGVNIIIKPFELRSILSVFDLHLGNSSSLRVGVFTPGFTDSGLDIYRNLSSKPNKENPINLNRIPLSVFTNMNLLATPSAAQILWTAIFEKLGPD